MNNKKYEILKSLPPYGPMYIPVSESGKPFYSEGFPVRFYKSDGNSWVANFELGGTDFNAVFELESPYLLVISGGSCFIMNPDEVKPFEIFGGDYINYLMSSDGRIILYNNFCLTVINSRGNYWDSKTISMDGFAEMKISKNNIITGLSYKYCDLWIPFEYNIDTKKLIYNKRIYKEMGNYYIENKKPWWKFW